MQSALCSSQSQKGMRKPKVAMLHIRSWGSSECTPLHLSPSPSDSADSRQTVGVDGRINPDHASMEGCLMVGGGDLPINRLPSPPSYPVSETAVVSGSPPTPFNGLAVMHKRVSSTGISNTLAEFISFSIRGSTQRTYKSAWRSWHDWFRSRDSDAVLFSETNLAEYLWFLFFQNAI